MAPAHLFATFVCHKTFCLVPCPRRRHAIICSHSSQTLGILGRPPGTAASAASFIANHASGTGFLLGSWPGVEGSVPESLPSSHCVPVINVLHKTPPPLPPVIMGHLEGFKPGATFSGPWVVPKIWGAGLLNSSPPPPVKGDLSTGK